MNPFTRLWFHVLRFFDDVAPGWSMRVDRPYAERTSDSTHISAESLTYWLTDERCRRARD